MIKKLLIITILQLSLFGCALCNVYQPTITPKITFETNKDTLTKADITWKFTPEFSAELSRDYDKNANNTFEKDEVKAIQRSIIEYIKPLNFLTILKFNPASSNKNIDQIPPINIKEPTYQTYFVNDLLHFSYQIDLNLKVTSKDVLFLTIHDEGGYFIFKFKDDDIAFNEFKLNATPNSRANAVFIEFNQKGVKQKVTTEKKQETKIENNEQKTLLSDTLQNISDKLQVYLKQIKEQNSLSAFLFIMLFSLMYGAVHAAGPGHGKTVVASYIFSTGKNIQKALIIALLIGLVHAFSAFILTLLIYFLVTGFLMPFVDQVEQVVTKLSAVVIIAIAVTLLYKKIRTYYANKNLTKFSIHKPTCSCASCKVDSKTTDLGVILSAGLVPCPGTVIIFIVTISQSMLMIGFMSAVMMSLGMSLIIFLTALFSIGLKKQVSDQKLITIFEYSSLVLILIIGSLMLLI